MTIQLFGIYITSVVLLCLTPGPNSLLAVTNSVRFGSQKALFSTLGCATGLALLIAACLSGLGIIIATSETLFTFIKWLGAGYLIYLGLKLFFTKDFALTEATAKNVATIPGNKKLFVQGFLVVVSNPKVVLFFSAFLPQFYSSTSHFLPQFLVLAGTFIVVEITLELLLAKFAEKIKKYLTSARSTNWINRATGGMFISAGVLLLTYQRSDN